MKRVLFILTVVALSFGVFSCDIFGTLDESEAVEVVQALVSPVAGSGSMSRALDRATASFSYTDTQEDGSAEFTFTVNTTDADTSATMDGTMQVTFDNYVTSIVNEDGETKEYTVTGTIYYDLRAYMDYSGTTLVYTYEIDMYTTNSVEVTGEGVSTDVDLDITETMDMTMTVSGSSYSYTISYDCSGTINDIEIEGESGTFTYSYTE